MCGGGMVISQSGACVLYLTRGVVGHLLGTVRTCRFGAIYYKQRRHTAGNPSSLVTCRQPHRPRSVSGSLWKTCQVRCQGSWEVRIERVTRDLHVRDSCNVHANLAPGNKRCSNTLHRLPVHTCIQTLTCTYMYSNAYLHIHVLSRIMQPHQQPQ